jgi:hypothetical protein
MQIKTSMRFHLTLVRILTIKETNKEMLGVGIGRGVREATLIHS